MFIMIAVIAAFAMCGTTPAVGSDPGAITGYASLESLLDAARRAQRADLESWGRYRFRRQAVRAKLDSDGRVSSRTDMESIVTPLPPPTSAGGPPRFDEALIRLDGAAPTAAQVDHHRQDAPFSRHYATTIGNEGAEEEGGYSLSFLLRMSSYRHDGEEKVDGQPCHRIRFEADTGAKGDDLETRFARAVAGTLWLTVEGAHMARASVHSVAPINITFGIVRLSELDIEMGSQALASGSWVPRTIETRSTVRIMGVPMRRLNRYSYSEFVPATAVPDGAAGR